MIVLLQINIGFIETNILLLTYLWAVLLLTIPNQNGNKDYHIFYKISVIHANEHKNPTVKQKSCIIEPISPRIFKDFL